MRRCGQGQWALQPGGSATGEAMRRSATGFLWTPCRRHTGGTRQDQRQAVESVCPHAMNAVLGVEIAGIARANLGDLEGEHILDETDGVERQPGGALVDAVERADERAVGRASDVG